MNKKVKMIQSVDRAIDILTIISREEIVGVTEIAKQLGLHVATVHNIVKTLALRNYVMNDKRAYRLGPGIMAIASRCNLENLLPGKVMPYLEKVSKTTCEASHLGIMIGLRMEVLAHVPSSDEITVQFPRSTVSYALKYATGRALLALGDTGRADRAVECHINACPDKGYEEGWSRYDWIMELKDIRKKGYCILKRPGKNSADQIAVPVWNQGGQVIAAMGASTPSFRSTPAHRKDMLKVLQEASMALSRVMGYEIEEEKRMQILMK